MERISPLIAVFDHFDRFLLIPSFLGIKVIDIESGNTLNTLGKSDSSERFTTIALFQGRAKRVEDSASSSLDSSRLLSSSHVDDFKFLPEDPTVFATAFKKQRFYLFSRREPGDM